MLIAANGVCANKMSEALELSQTYGSARFLFASNFYHWWVYSFVDLGISLELFLPDSVFILTPSHAQPHSKFNLSFLIMIISG